VPLLLADLVGYQRKLGPGFDGTALIAVRSLPAVDDGGNTFAIEPDHLFVGFCKLLADLFVGDTAEAEQVRVLGEQAARKSVVENESERRQKVKRFNARAVSETGELSEARLRGLGACAQEVQLLSEFLALLEGAFSLLHNRFKRLVLVRMPVVGCGKGPDV
jgi:hypothetical protein